MNKAKQLVLLLLPFIVASCSVLQPNYTIFLAGDSTMAWKAENKSPETGWGMLLPNYLNKNVNVDNRAINGMSTHSFIAEGFWNKLISEVDEGDYVFIQFGHNDTRIDRKDRYASPDSYKANLVKFVNEVRTKKATPVLLTSIERRNFDSDGNFIPAHGVYPEVMRKVALDKNVVLLDVNIDSRKLIKSLGSTESKKLFLIAEPNTLENYPDGINDNTHLNYAGATIITELIINEIKLSLLEIKKDIK